MKYWIHWGSIFKLGSVLNATTRFTSTTSNDRGILLVVAEPVLHDSLLQSNAPAFNTLSDSIGNLRVHTWDSNVVPQDFFEAMFGSANCNEGTHWLEQMTQPGSNDGQQPVTLGGCGAFAF